MTAISKVNHSSTFVNVAKVGLFGVGAVALAAGTFFAISYTGHGVSAFQSNLLGRISMIAAFTSGGLLVISGCALTAGTSKKKEKPVTRISKLPPKPVTATTHVSAAIHPKVETPPLPPSGYIPNPQTSPVMSAYKSLLSIPFNPNNPPTTTLFDLPVPQALKEGVVLKERDLFATAAEEIDKFGSASLVGMSNQSKFDQGEFPFYSSKEYMETRKKIDQRLEQLDRAVQFTQRWAYVPIQLRNIVIMEDLELPWNESGLMIILMSQAEFDLTMTLERIESLSERQWSLFMLRFGMPDPHFSVQMFSNDPFSKNLHLSEFRCLPANSIPSDTHPRILSYVSKNQMERIEFERLNDDQFKAIFKLYPIRVRFLSTDQIYKCIHRFDQNMLRHLDPAQIKLLNLRKIPDDQFNLMFPNVALNDGKHTFICDLYLQQINDNLARFKGTRLTGLSEDQVRRFDYTNPNLTQSHFNAIIPDPTPVSTFGLVVQRFSCLDQRQVQNAWRFLDAARIVLINNVMLPTIDLDLYKLNAEQFNALFPAKGKSQNALDASRIRVLTNQQIYDLVDQNLMDAERFFYLTDKQIQEYDFADEPLPQPFVDILFATAPKGEESIQYIAHNRFALLDVEKQIYPLLPALKGIHLAKIQKGQLEKFDFAKHPVNQDQFNGMFPPIDDRHFNLPNSASAFTKIHWLNDAQIASLIPRFDADRMFLLSPTQIKNLDLKALSDTQFHGLFRVANNNNGIINDMTRYKLAAIDFAKHLYPNQARWTGTQLRYLEYKRLREINFSDFRLSRAQFDELFLSGEESLYSCVQYLEGSQIKQLRDLFDYNRAACITPSQIPGMEISKTDYSEEMLKGMFLTPSTYSTRTEEIFSRVAQLEPAAINKVAKYFTPYLHLITPKQFQELDLTPAFAQILFGKGNPTPDVLQKIAVMTDNQIRTGYSKFPGWMSEHMNDHQRVVLKSVVK